MQHPLFPDHEDDGRELAFIRVWRHLPDGTRNIAPQSYGTDELSDIDVFYDLFGGGKYEVVAHGGDGKIITRNRLSFEGKPKPLSGEPPQGGVPSQPGQPADGSPWAMMMTFLQMQMQMAQVQSKQQTELMLALLGRQDQNSAQHVQTMQALHDRFAQSQTQLLGMILQAGKSGEGGSEAFMKGVEYAQEFARGAAEAAAEGSGGGDDDDLLSTIGQVASAFGASRPAAQAAAQSQPPPQQPQGGPNGGLNGASS